MDEIFEYLFLFFVGLIICFFIATFRSQCQIGKIHFGGQCHVADFFLE